MAVCLKWVSNWRIIWQTKVSWTMQWSSMSTNSAHCWYRLIFRMRNFYFFIFFHVRCVMCRSRNKVCGRPISRKSVTTQSSRLWTTKGSEKLLELCTDQPWRDVGICNRLQISVLYHLQVNFLFTGMFHWMLWKNHTFHSIAKFCISSYTLRHLRLLQLIRMPLLPLFIGNPRRRSW